MPLASIPRSRGADLLCQCAGRAAKGPRTRPQCDHIAFVHLGLMLVSARPRPAAAVSSPAIVIFAQRDRARAMARSIFPRRRNRLVLTRTSAAFAQIFGDMLVDAAIVDLGSSATSGEETWRVAGLAREFASVACFGLVPLRVCECPTVAPRAAWA